MKKPSNRKKRVRRKRNAINKARKRKERNERQERERRNALKNQPTIAERIAAKQKSRRVPFDPTVGKIYNDF